MLGSHGIVVKYAVAIVFCVVNYYSKFKVIISKKLNTGFIDVDIGKLSVEGGQFY